MSDKAGGGNGKATGEQEEQEEIFVAVETDDKGVPLNAESTSDQAEDLDEEEQAEGADDDSDDDERVGHDETDDEGTYEGETPEQKRLRRRRQNKAKRIRNRVAAESKDRLIASQGQMLLDMQEQLARLEGRTVQYDVNMLANQLSQIESQQAEAKKVYANLLKADDHDGVAEVVEIQMNLREQHREIQSKLQRAKTAAAKVKGGAADGATDDARVEQQPARQRPRQQLDPEVLDRARAWAQQNRWYNPNGKSEDINIVKAIDAAVHADGFDPRTQDYWDELQERVQRRLPEKFKARTRSNNGNGGRVDNGSGNGGNRPANGGPRMATASQSGNGSRSLGKNEVRVSPERKAAMIAAGKWDDPVARNRQLAAYAKYDRENAAR